MRETLDKGRKRKVVELAHQFGSCPVGGCESVDEETRRTHYPRESVRRCYTLYGASRYEEFLKRGRICLDRIGQQRIAGHTFAEAAGNGLYKLTDDIVGDRRIAVLYEVIAFAAYGAVVEQTWVEPLASECIALVAEPARPQSSARLPGRAARDNTVSFIVVVCMGFR